MIIINTRWINHMKDKNQKISGTLKMFLKTGQSMPGMWIIYNLFFLFWFFPVIFFLPILNINFRWETRCAFCVSETLCVIGLVVMIPISTKAEVPGSTIEALAICVSKGYFQFSWWGNLALSPFKFLLSKVLVSLLTDLMEGTGLKFQGPEHTSPAWKDSYSAVSMATLQCSTHVCATLSARWEVKSSFFVLGFISWMSIEATVFGLLLIIPFGLLKVLQMICKLYSF